MAKLRSNFLSGTITNNPLSNVATTINSAAFANLPVVTGGDELTLVLDPTGAAGAPEIVKVTAHSASATSVTAVRGQEGTSGRQHASGTAWRHTATSADFITVCTSSTRPTTGLYEGRLIYETDTNKVMAYTGTDWAPRDAGGTLGYAQVTAGQASITAEVDLTSLAVTVTAGTGRMLRLSGRCMAQSSVANDSIQLRIKEGATVLQIAQMTVPKANVSEFIYESVVLSSPSAGSHTYKLTMQRSLGTGNVVMDAGPTFPAYILVEDIGAA